MKVNPLGANVVIDTTVVTLPPGTGSTMQGPYGANLFVHGDLSGVTDQDLAKIFNEHGTCIGAKVKVASSSGHAFVSYDNTQSAYDCIAALNGKDIFMKGSTVKVLIPKKEESYNPEAVKLREQQFLSVV